MNALIWGGSIIVIGARGRKMIFCCHSFFFKFQYFSNIKKVKLKENTCKLRQLAYFSHPDWMDRGGAGARRTVKSKTCLIPEWPWNWHKTRWPSETRMLIGWNREIDNYRKPAGPGPNWKDREPRERGSLRSPRKRFPSKSKSRERKDIGAEEHGLVRRHWFTWAQSQRGGSVDAVSAEWRKIRMMARITCGTVASWSSLSGNRLISGMRAGFTS